MSEKIKILFEDNSLLLCLKPVGVSSQPDPSGDEDMVTLLQQSRPEIYPIHRLDKGVGGMMVFAKKQACAGKLSAMIQSREIEKEYLAVVHGILPEKEGILRDLLYRDVARNKSFVVAHMRKGVKEAELEYRVLEEVEGMSLVRVKLHTGRSHQIRVQFSSRGLPLVGDGKYGGGNGNIALWSYRLAFRHPFRNIPVESEFYPPKTAPWDRFSAIK